MNKTGLSKNILKDLSTTYKNNLRTCEFPSGQEFLPAGKTLLYGHIQSAKSN